MSISAARAGSPPTRIDGYAPLRDYAVIGDGRTAALVASDGQLDWLSLPDLDSPSVFGAVLDGERGGRFALTPEAPFRAARRYVPGTNVLETTFWTDEGAVQVTDALSLPDDRLGPLRELQRRVAGLSGRVVLRWRVEPRFGYATRRGTIGRRQGVPVATSGSDAIAVRAFDAGEPILQSDVITGRFEATEGTTATIALCAAHQEPLVFPARRELEQRLEATIATWQRWAGAREYDGPWRDAVVRSALALKLLVFAPSGAVAAAATTSLPEELGGERNWDYRFSWIRDSAFTLGAFLQLGCAPEADAYFWWLMHASQLTHPWLKVLYRLDGGARAAERELPLEGYRASTPVRIGNAAVDQLQLDTYGELMQAAFLYAQAGNTLDADVAKRLAEIANLVCVIWTRPDAGIWEVRSDPAQFTQSKMMCWIALDRAISLAERGILPSKRLAHWRSQRDAIAEFVERRCWSHDRRSYVRFEGGSELDAGVLLGVLLGYGGDPSRFGSTLDALRRELCHGPFVRRYTGDDGLSGNEGAFVACSFWLVEALARAGRVEEAAELMDSLVGLGNEVGLYAEEIDPASGEFLGNFPQGLSHLSLISAAVAIDQQAGR